MFITRHMNLRASFYISVSGVTEESRGTILKICTDVMFLFIITAMVDYARCHVIGISDTRHLKIL